MNGKVKDKKFTILIGVGAVIIFVALVILSIVIIRPVATLDILVAPTSAQVMINGKEYSNGTYTLSPGEITAVISKDGFEGKEIKLELIQGETAQLYTYLLPADGSYDWYLDHEEDMMVLNTIGDARAIEESASYKKKYPAIEALPIIYAKYDENWDYTEFRIDGGDFDECEEDFCLKITDTTGGNYEFALSLIREKGFNPDDFEIIYEYKPIEPLE